MLRRPRGHHEVGNASADPRDPVVEPSVDEFREQVVLVGRLEVDPLAPGRITQPRTLGLAVLHVTLEAIAHQPRQEPVPLGAVERVDLLAEALDQVAGATHGFAEIVPCAPGGQSILGATARERGRRLLRVTHPASPAVGSGRTPNRS